MNAQVRSNLMKPVAMTVCLGYRSLSAFANIHLSEGLAALNCASGISLRSLLAAVCFSISVAPK
jgi:hypothetical protein